MHSSLLLATFPQPFPNNSIQFFHEVLSWEHKLRGRFYITTAAQNETIQSKTLNGRCCAIFNHNTEVHGRRPSSLGHSGVIIILLFSLNNFLCISYSTHLFTPKIILLFAILMD